MNERIRRAAELAVRLDRQLLDRAADCISHGKTWTDCNSTKIAQDVDRLLRLSASLRGAAEKKGIEQDKHLSQISMERERRLRKREQRLISAVTDTLKFYGLTWRHNTDPRGPAVGVLFPDAAMNEFEWRV